jgi:hypothetical protein
VAPFAIRSFADESHKDILGRDNSPIITIIGNSKFSQALSSAEFKFLQNNCSAELNISGYKYLPSTVTWSLSARAKSQSCFHLVGNTRYESGTHYFEIFSTYTNSPPIIGVMEENATCDTPQSFTGLGICIDGSNTLFGSYATAINLENGRNEKFESPVHTAPNVHALVHLFLHLVHSLNCSDLSCPPFPELHVWYFAGLGE